MTSTKRMPTLPATAKLRRYKVRTYHITLRAGEWAHRNEGFLGGPAMASGTAADLFAALDPDVEHFPVFHLNVQNEIVAVKMVGSGTVEQVAVYPRMIIRDALLLGSAGIVLCHNHPSGYVDPSKEDKRLTETIRSAARFMDIRLLDHLIIGHGGRYCSMAEKGLL